MPFERQNQMYGNVLFSFLILEAPPPPLLYKLNFKQISISNAGGEINEKSFSFIPFMGFTRLTRSLYKIHFKKKNLIIS